MKTAKNVLREAWRLGDGDGRAAAKGCVPDMEWIVEFSPLSSASEYPLRTWYPLASLDSSRDARPDWMDDELASTFASKDGAREYLADVKARRLLPGMAEVRFRRV